MSQRDNEILAEFIEIYKNEQLTRQLRLVSMRIHSERTGLTSMHEHRVCSSSNMHA